jgi:hypothetical protein
MLYVPTPKTLLTKPARVYVVWYLLLIPIFGVIYSLHSGQFYHGTVKYEAYLNHNADKLMEEIKTHWMAEHGGRTGNMLKATQYYGTTITQNLSTLDLFRPEVDGEYLVFDVKSKGKWQMSSDRPDVPLDLSFKARLHATCLHLGTYHIPDKDHLDGDYVLLHFTTRNYGREPNGFVDPLPLPETSPIVSLPSRTNDNNSEELPRLVISEPAAIPIPESVLPFLMNEDAGHHYHLRVPKSLADRVSEFVQAANGFPSSVDGNWCRMMYFSVTTITTLGFGDIVPLTGVARALVALEAILGIVLIGMFLNALAARYRMPPPGSKQVGETPIQEVT